MTENSRFGELADAAERYGSLSLENYAQIRNVAENVSDGFCRYLSAGKGRCVYLVPPEGAWAPQPFQSGAFSVSGTGFLPLEPIRFGLAVRVSRSGDWLRLVLSCSKSGPAMEITIEGGRHFSLAFPIQEAELQELFRQLHRHLIDFFEDHSNHFQHGAYGQRSMGFDFTHVEEEE